MSNEEHLHNIETNIGVLTIIQTVRQNRPSGLKRPYEYIAPLDKVKTLCDDLKKYLKPKESCWPKIIGFQCAGLSTKPVSKGIRFSLFLLGYHNEKPHKYSDSHVSEQEWNETCQHVQKMIFDVLGEDARMYIDKYNKTKKFQARFETYIAYNEFL